MSEQKSTADQLFEAMDREALRMIAQLDGHETLEADERLKAFKAAQEWLQRREKLRPRKESEEPQGVEALKEMLRDEIRAAVRVPRRPTAKAGRSGEGSELAKAVRQ